MHIVKENTVFKVEFKQLIKFGTIEDSRINEIETSVSAYYKTTVLEMLDWRKDTDAKLMVCFLLNQKLNYSIPSLANWYGINRHYLRNSIVAQFEKCLTDSLQMRLVDDLAICLDKNNSTLDIASKLI
jgi:hypothetical protein